MQRKKPPVSHVPRARTARSDDGKETHDRWLITYSDLITLLMIFFVIMYSSSSISAGKFRTLALSLAKGFHSAPVTAPVSPAPSSKSTTKPKAQTQLDTLYRKLQSYVKAHQLQDYVDIYDEQRGVRITLRDVALFASGDATLKPNAKTLLHGLTPFFLSVNNAIVIQGYTDNQPIDTPQYASNWDLSGARAAVVIRFFIQDRVAQARLSGAIYADNDPEVPNTTPANRQKNRRVNIIILRQ